MTSETKGTGLALPTVDRSRPLTAIYSSGSLASLLSSVDLTVRPARLPVGTTLTDRDRSSLCQHAGELEATLRPGPPEAVLSAVAELLLCFPQQGAGDRVAEVRARAYLRALDDVPAWCVREAADRWLRGEAGERNYSFAPSTAELRKVALEIMLSVKGMARAYRRLAEAVVETEYSDEHRLAMLERLAGVIGGAVEAAAPAAAKPKETAA
jgi:hypothetical protein